jgi:hypothetical protein
VAESSHTPASVRWVIATLRDAAIVVALSTALALTANALRRDRSIPLVARRPYDILVPCPEHKGSAAPIAAAQLVIGERGLLLLDARDREAFTAWHPAGATSLPYDYLEPPTAEVVQRVLSSRARRVVIYGDGDDPDSGEQLARELNRKGVKNVAFVVGGARALRGSPAPGGTKAATRPAGEGTRR